MSEVSCVYFPACGGCDHWGQSLETQKLNKIKSLRSTLNLSAQEIGLEKFISIKPYGLRQRFDFTVESQDDAINMGLYGENRKLIDLKVCLQLSPELQKAFEAFREIPFKIKDVFIKKASVRLRVSPKNEWGCWLDLANIDIKNLLDDSLYLTQLLKAGFQIEMGQKGKALKQVDGKFKLVDPEPKSWFQQDRFELKCLISDFTQPSWETGEKLVDVVLGWTQKLQIHSAIEYGPGIGPFTLALLSKNIRVHAFENNPKAIEVLQINAKLHGLEKNLSINPERTGEHDLVFVNPPRSGLKDFVKTIIQTQAKHCIYISCFPESMKIDIDQLKAAGYQIKDVRIVDQFPQTKHYESCVLLEKI